MANSMLVKMMIWVEILLVVRVRQEVAEEGSICIEKHSGGGDMVACDRKLPRRGGRSTNFDCILHDHVTAFLHEQIKFFFSKKGLSKNQYFAPM